MKKALITGITGQDGSYLAELLCEKGYQVFGMVRRASLPNTSRINHLIDSSLGKNIKLLDGDLTDTSSIFQCLKEVEPDEVYNLGAQSHVGVSFASPEYTADVDAIGTLRILEGIRCLNMKSKTKFYQASTSELYGLVQEMPQKEDTPFYPRSPYAVAKLYSYWITVNYREAYGMFACNGILFNHESPRRGETFVTRKITKSISEIALGKREFVALGNLSSLRDWGHAQDYVLMQWMMLQQSTPKDYVIATGEQYSVRDFLIWSAAVLGIGIKLQGSGEDEVGIVTSIKGDKAPGVRIGQVIAKVDKEFFRPAEVETLLGDPKLAKADLNWCPKITVREMCEEMVLSDYHFLLSQ